MLRENVQILLATTPDTPVHEIEEQLEQTLRLDCHLFLCSDLAACLDRLHEHSFHFDLILLDLTLVANQDSENFFTKIQDAAPDTPVIVFVPEEDRELGLYMVQKGASIISNTGKFKLERNRLRDLIDHSWISQKNTRDRREIVEAARMAEIARSTKELREEKEAGVRRLREKDQVITWMSGGYSVEGNPKPNDD